MTPFAISLCLLVSWPGWGQSDPAFKAHPKQPRERPSASDPSDLYGEYHGSPGVFLQVTVSPPDGVSFFVCNEEGEIRGVSARLKPPEVAKTIDALKKAWKTRNSGHAWSSEAFQGFSLPNSLTVKTDGHGKVTIRTAGLSSRNSRMVQDTQDYTIPTEEELQSIVDTAQAMVNAKKRKGSR